MLRLNEYAIKLDREMERNKVLNLFPVINQELRRQSYKINFCLKKTMDLAARPNGNNKCELRNWRGLLS